MYLIKYSITFLFSIILFNGCAAKDIVNHTFEFDAGWESPDIEVLNYQYGNSKLIGVRPPKWVLKDTPQGATGVTGPMLRGEFLYVKWRIKETGEVLEDRVDLKERLPRNIEGCRIHFIVRGRQLYVYLISPKPNPDRFQKPPLPMYADLKVIEIYPAQPKK